MAVHGDKLSALRANPKLPAADLPSVEGLWQAYITWIRDLETLPPNDEAVLVQAVQLLDAYKRALDLAVFDSEQDFLYRQKGQLKLDNTIVEEFLPYFVQLAIGPQLQHYGLSIGPTTCFASVFFDSSLTRYQAGAGLQVRQKNQDFAITRPFYIQAAHDPSFGDASTIYTHLAYVALECKTNLDKTMFQEAAATAYDLKTSVPAAKYFLLCEWLDMTPIQSSTTAIDEVLVLRKAKRLSSSVRQRFATANERVALRAEYEAYLRENPFSVEVWQRLAEHLQALVNVETEDDVLRRGHF